MLNSQHEMPFLEHLEALRWHLVRVLIVIGICTVAAFIGKYILFHVVILAPTRSDFLTYLWLCKLGDMIQIKAFCVDKLPFLLQSRRMSGQLTMHVGAAAVAGLIISFPYVFWEIWRFVRPALRATERGTLQWTTVTVSILFFMGVVFGYYILVPVSVHFLANYQIDETVVNHFDIVSYVSTVLILVLCSGLVFQLPLLVYFLTKERLLSVSWLLRYKRHALLVTFVLGAMITPPDPFSQTLVALPLILLYFFSIFIAKIVEGRRRRSLNLRAGDET